MNQHINEQSIALLAGDDLDLKRKAEIFRHLDGCMACRRMLDEYREERECLAQMREQSVTASDCALIKYSISRLIGARRTRSIGSSLRWAVSVSILLVIAATFLLTWNRTGTLLPLEQASHPVPYRPIEKQPAIGLIKSESITQGIYPDRQKSKKSRDLPKQRHSLTPVAGILSAVESQDQADKSDRGDDIVILLETEDPNVSIFWLASR
jgi:hypothetical protein